MRGSKKGQVPTSYEAWIASGTEDSPSLYKDMLEAVKAELRNKLALEQRGSCVYCGRRLSTNLFPTEQHIEHFRPQHLYSHLATEYLNMFLSCGPVSRSGASVRTCGHVKGGWFEDGMIVEPDYDICQTIFTFDFNGYIGTDMRNDVAMKTIDVLELNERELRREREELFQLMEEELQAEGAQSLADFFDTLDQEGFEESLAYAAKSWLRSQFTYS